jgi:hypothetical protein
MAKITEKYGFIKTKEKMEVTFDGWDGKSYDGETRKMAVWTHPRFGDKKFVNLARVGGFERIDGTHYSIDAFFEITDEMVIEKATGIAHPVVTYYCSEER